MEPGGSTSSFSTSPPTITPSSAPTRFGTIARIAAFLGIVVVAVQSPADTAAILGLRTPPSLRAGDGSIAESRLPPSSAASPSSGPPRCECTPESPRYISVRPCSGLVNQQFCIAHATLIASVLGAEVLLEELGSRGSFEEAKFIEASRSPPTDFYDLPSLVTDEYGRTVILNGALPSSLATCVFPEVSMYRARAMSIELEGLLRTPLEESCGVRIGCSFYGVRPQDEPEREFLVNALMGLKLNPQLRALADAAIAKLRAASLEAAGGGGAGEGTIRKHAPFAAAHLRVEPDMNDGKPMPVPTNDVRAALLSVGVGREMPVGGWGGGKGGTGGEGGESPSPPPPLAIFVASGISEKIMGDLPDFSSSGVVWLNRHMLLGPEVQKSFSAEQLALVDLAICQASSAFIGDVRSTFSVAAANVVRRRRKEEEDQGNNVGGTNGMGPAVGWYFGSLSMWASDATMLGLPPQ